MSTLKWRQRRGHRRWGVESEKGSSLLGILSVVATLGVLAVIVLTLNFGATPSTPRSSISGSPHTTTTTGPQDIASEQQVAQRAACQANFSAVMTAVTYYRSLNGSNPPAGTALATSKDAGGPYLQTWPSGAPAYTLRWNGAALSVVPAKGRASIGSFGTLSPPTGCFG